MLWGKARVPPLNLRKLMNLDAPKPRRLEKRDFDYLPRLREVLLPKSDQYGKKKNGTFEYVEIKI